MWILNLSGIPLYASIAAVGVLSGQTAAKTTGYHF